MKRRHDMPFGATVNTDGSVRFRLWAPGASNVELCLHDRHELRFLSMEQDPSGWCSLDTDQAAVGTLYSYCIDHSRDVPDPASRFQPSDAHGASQVIDPASAEWRDERWHGRPWEEAIIGTLQLGGAAGTGAFRGAIERLDDLAERGVTALELMPLTAVSGGRHRGYDGLLPFAPDSRYGSPQELKNLIQAAHEREMMVFLGGVPSHFGPQSHGRSALLPAHQAPRGGVINFDANINCVARQFFIHNALYWLEEYHFDGLRLDVAPTLDADPESDLLEELALQVRNGPGRERSVHLILENDRGGALA